MQLPGLLHHSADCLGTIEPRPHPAPLEAEEIRRALLQPIGPDKDGTTVFDVIQPGESVCFVVSDHTRKTGADAVLPVLLRGLIEKGCSPDDLSILIASGIHRPPRPEEIARILGADTAARFEGRIHLHDPDDDRGLVAVGTTGRGHRVRVNRRVVEADRLVPIGGVVYHYHAGFGGGRKSLVPGVAARESIAHNHGLTLDPDHDRIRPDVRIGRLDGNPVSEEMLEAARLCEPDMIVNTVCTPAGRPVGVFSGELDAAHRAACAFAESVYGIPIDRPADFVVAWSGPALTWIQAHKALVNAHRAVRDGGRVILIAPCPEGLGNERFRYWIRKKDLSSLFKELRRNTEVIGQTAISTKMRGERTILVTDMPRGDCEDLGIETADTVDAALRRTLDELGENGRRPTCILMPAAAQTVPFPGQTTSRWITHGA